jgi:hypothetical protein
MHIYAAVRRGEVTAYEFEGTASTLYPESQLEKLARDIGRYSETSAA